MFIFFGEFVKRNEIKCEACAQISHFILFTCEELVQFFSDVKNWYQIFTNVKNWYQILTRVKDRYQILTSVKIGYQIITCEKLVSSHTCEGLVPNLYTCENLVPNHHRCENWDIIVIYVSDKTVKNWNRMQNAADFGGILSM